MVRFLKDYSDDLNQKDSPKDLVLKFEKELRDLCKYDSDTKNIFGFVNNWWVFSEVSKDINYQILCLKPKMWDTNELYVLKNLQLMTL